jgi:NAD-dependent deacetylase
LNKKITQLKNFLNNSSIITILSGAGLSTASGLPDFRTDDQGFWKKNKPVHFSEFVKSESARIKSWQNNLAIRASIKDKKPSLIHGYIVELLRKNELNTHITQNIDGLHYLEEIESQIIELHGSVFGASCLSCFEKYDPETFYKSRVKELGSTTCTSCNGGYVKTSTISFGQKLNEQYIKQATLASDRCDLFICLGTSLKVSPANHFPQKAKAKDANLVIINREPTPLDAIADLVIYDDLDNIYEKIS